MNLKLLRAISTPSLLQQMCDLSKMKLPAPVSVCITTHFYINAQQPRIIAFSCPRSSRYNLIGYDTENAWPPAGNVIAVDFNDRTNNATPFINYFATNTHRYYLALELVVTKGC